MCYQRKAIVDIEPDTIPIQIGNGNIIYSHGRGRIGTLSDVYYVPDLQFNLLSVAHLNTLGYTVTFRDDGTVILSDRALNAIELGHYSNGVFVTGPTIFSLVKINESDSSLTTAASLTSIAPHRIPYQKLLHNRFAHINYHYIDIAIKLKLITGIKNITSFSYSFCESCVLAKSIRVSSKRTPGSSHSNKRNPSKQVTFSEPLVQTPSLTHILTPLSKFVVDIKGPINVSATKAKRYALIFTVRHGFDLQHISLPKEKQ